MLMEYEKQQMTQAWIVLGCVGVVYLLRNVHWVFKFIWAIISLVLTAIFIVIFANYAKDTIKKWWNE